MELKVERFNNLIIENCQTIKECHTQLSALLLDFQYSNPERAEIDRNLVMMSVASRKVLDLVSPLPSSGEIHGLPKEATQFGDEPDVLIVDKENPKWDFRPWFTEKATVISDSLNRLMQYLETDPEKLEFAPNASTTPQEFVTSMIRMNLAEIGNKADAILDMVQSGRLTVTDVKLEDNEP